MIYIMADNGLVGGSAYAQRVEIVADTEDEILALGEMIAFNDEEIRVEPGSVAYTADLSAMYIFSPGKTWTKA